MIDQKTEWHIAFEGHYTRRHTQELTKVLHMFTKGIGPEGKTLAHVDSTILKADCNIAINEALRQIENGGYISIDIKVVNP